MSGSESVSRARERRGLLLWSVLLVLGLLLPWVASQCPDAVERVYSKGLFRPIAMVLGWIGGRVEFSLAQIVVGIVFAALVAWLAILIVRLRRRDGAALLAWSRVAIAVLAIGIWSFELTWGLQYARPSLATRLQLPEVEPTAQRLASLTRWLADETNRSFAMAVRTGEIAPGAPLTPGSAAHAPGADLKTDRGSGAFTSGAAFLAGEASGEAARAVRISGEVSPPEHLPLAPSPAEPGSSRFLVPEKDVLAGLDRAYRSVEPTLRDVRFSRPKRPQPAGRVLSRLGISGIYFPFTGEATVNALLPPVSFPFTAAHEMAHQRGIAREDEANLAAFLACRETGYWCARYGGSLSAYLRVRGALWKTAPDSVRGMGELLAAGPQSDVEAIRSFWARYEGTANAVAERVNDTYLKANRQAAGVASYDLMVQILVAFREAGMLGPAAKPASR